jgi:hypothetical protein
MDTYADDLAEFVQKLDLKDAIHVSHSTGGGEVARYIGRHGTKRVAKAVLIGAVPPLMVRTAANPGGLPIDVFDGIRKGVLSDRSQFFKDLTMPFYDYNRPGANVSEGARESFWLQGMMAGMPASYFCIKAFSESDQTEDLKKIDKPTLILHGDDDQIVPIGASAMVSSKLEGRDVEGLQGRAARHVHNAEGRGECRPPCVHRGLIAERRAVIGVISECDRTNQPISSLRPRGTRRSNHRRTHFRSPRGWANTHRRGRIGSLWTRFADKNSTRNSSKRLGNAISTRSSTTSRIYRGCSSFTQRSAGCASYPNQRSSKVLS